MLWELSLGPLQEQRALTCKPSLKPLFVLNSVSDCTLGTARNKEDGVDAENKEKKRVREKPHGAGSSKASLGVPQHTDETLQQQQREEGREPEQRGILTK